MKLLISKCTYFATLNIFQRLFDVPFDLIVKGFTGGEGDDTCDGVNVELITVLCNGLVDGKRKVVQVRVLYECDAELWCSVEKRKRRYEAFVST